MGGANHLHRIRQPCNNRSVIELWGTRYAAGNGISRAMRILCKATLLQYVVLLLSFAFIIFDDKSIGIRYSDIASVLFLVFTVLLYFCGLLAAILAGLLDGTQKQRPKNWERQSILKQLRNPTSPGFLLFVAMSPILPMVAIVASAGIYRLLDFPAAILNVATLLVALATGYAHTKFFYGVSGHMSREVAKGKDLFRGFDWSLVNTNGRKRFRDRYRNDYWKYPDDAIRDAEVDLYIQRARAMHSLVLILNTVTSLLITFVIADLFKRTVAQWAQPSTGQNMLTAVAMTTALGVLLLLFFVPLYLQRRASLYEDLRKEYEKYLEKGGTSSSKRLPGVRVVNGPRPFAPRHPRRTQPANVGPPA